MLAQGLNGHVGISRSVDDSRKLCGSFFGNNPFQLVCAVQCPTIKNYKYVNQHMIPFPNNQKLIRGRKPLSRVNVTGLLGQLQVKIGNIYLFKIIKRLGNVFKNWLCPNFLLLPKKSELLKIWGDCSPPSPPPGPYAYGLAS